VALYVAQLVYIREKSPLSLYIFDGLAWFLSRLFVLKLWNNLQIIKRTFDFL
jgi:hypothetical protein